MSTRPHVDRVLRAWAIAAFAFWIFAAALVVGSGTNAHAAPSVADTFVAPADEPRLEQRRTERQTTVDDVSKTVMCPSCDSTLDQSDSPAADRMRIWITDAVEAGWTEQEIRDGLVAEYGGDEAILAVPRSGGIGVGAWLAPLLIVLAILAAGVLVPRRWRRARAARGTDQTTLGSRSQSSSSSRS